MRQRHGDRNSECTKRLPNEASRVHSVELVSQEIVYIEDAELRARYRCVNCGIEFEHTIRFSS